MTDHQVSPSGRHRKIRSVRRRPKRVYARGKPTGNCLFCRCVLSPGSGFGGVDCSRGTAAGPNRRRAAPVKSDGQRRPKLEGLGKWETADLGQEKKESTATQSTAMSSDIVETVTKPPPRGEQRCTKYPHQEPQV